MRRHRCFNEGGEILTVKKRQLPVVTNIKKWLRCPRCCAGSITFRSITKDYRCLRCGALFTADFDAESTTLKSEVG